MVHERLPGDLREDSNGPRSRSESGDDAVLPVVAHALLHSMAVVVADLAAMLNTAGREPAVEVRSLERAHRQANFVAEVLSDLARGLPAAAIDALEAIGATRPLRRLLEPMPLGALVYALDKDLFQGRCARCGWASPVVSDVDAAGRTAGLHRDTCDARPLSPSEVFEPNVIDLRDASSSHVKELSSPRSET